MVDLEWHPTGGEKGDNNDEHLYDLKQKIMNIQVNIENKQIKIKVNRWIQIIRYLYKGQ